MNASDRIILLEITLLVERAQARIDRERSHGTERERNIKADCYEEIRALIAGR
jgi:hypothetical protein